MLPPAVVPTNRLAAWLPALSLVIAAAAGGMAWNARRDSDALEREMVKRQSEAQAQVTAALTLARAAEDAARDAQAKAALLEARTADATVQRTQLESLMSSLSRTRDENALGEVEASLRAAVQQATWTGRTEPLVVAMKQADERLATLSGPRLAAVRRALARDLDRIVAAGVSDSAVLAQRLDEVLRRVDELPLTMQAPAAPADVRPSAGAVTHPHPSEVAVPTWRDHVAEFWSSWRQTVTDEARSLVRVTRVDQPQAMLLSPQQAYFLRENLKLRLLSARLAVLSRQADVAQTDLREAQRMLDAYYDRQSPRVGAAADALKQVAAAARQTAVPRPDDTLAALALANP
jgi:uroporphyrin-3 C-methyltransferase